jgi:hypothetical protein
MPFSVDRPHKMRYSEEWEASQNGTGSTVSLESMSTMSGTRMDAVLRGSISSLPIAKCNGATCVYQGMPSPNITAPHISYDKPKIGFLTGNFTSSPGSRVCSLDVDGYRKKKDAKFGIWLDHANLSSWKTVANEILNPFNETRFTCHPYYLVRMAWNHLDLRTYLSEHTMKAQGSSLDS